MAWIPIDESDVFSIVLIPDTQFLSETAAWTHHFQAAADWIAANKESRNIQLVLHLGDVVDNGNTTEFDRAAAPMATVWATGVPFASCIGNHDYDGGSPDNHTDTTNWNSYFGVDKYEVHSWWNGEFQTTDKSENLYFTTSLGGRPTLVLVLEFFPRSTIMTWAESVITDHPEYDVIVTTHAYLYHTGLHTEDGTAAGPTTYTLADYTSGGDMWRDHFSQFHNVVAVFNGHHIGGPNVADRTDTGDNGNIVFQQFSNFQDESQGGEGTIVILNVNPHTGWATREIYNPADDAFEATYEDSFQLYVVEAAVSDGDAIHDDVAGEIQAVTEKTTPADADLILIEDSAASYAKKRVQIGNLLPEPEATDGLITVDPGTVSSVIVSGDVEVTIDSDYGIDSLGEPYFNDLGATAGEEAALCFRPSDSKYVLVSYQE